jgi:3-hydroxyacyl-CoA dehydrogenase/3a,7a,12a-trihydroxy-5b-cholest-24-enoyl-CoA hydratase
MTDDDELRFDGQVVIVTGAGGGLGRSHARLFAIRGARVLVNDLGASHTGEGQSQRAADAVVDEIRAAGGEAEANYDSVEDGDRIVAQARERWGRVDAVVNNAGILRDVSFAKMTPEDWDLVYRVHVRGAFAVTHAAWPIMREQRAGRVVMTASAAGLYGNFGQANYAMAKLGLHGLAQTLALEGRKYGIQVNTIAPIAASRMTETVMPKEILEHLSPEVVSPLVAWLAHPDCPATGAVFEVGGGFMGQLRWERAAGKTWRVGRPIAPEDVRDRWDEITTFDEAATHPTNIAEATQPILSNVQRGPSRGGNQLIDVDEALGFTYPEQTSTYDARDLALYALGVGAGRDPMDPKELALVHERHGPGFRPLPTFGVVPALRLFFDFLAEGKQAPGLHYGLDRVLHGEQRLVLERPLPEAATLTHRARVADIFDKGKGATVVIDVESRDEDGDLLMTNTITTFVRGAGGWGGDRGPTERRNVPPDRDPDEVLEEATRPDQALLYRLSGDWNPLHADPGFAQAFGFERPILHGLCTFGFAGRHVVGAMAPEGDPRFVREIEGRFSGVVYPGETLRTEVWRTGEGAAVFQTKVKERDEVVLSNGGVRFWKTPPEKAPKPAAGPGTGERDETGSEDAAPPSARFFDALARYLETHPELVDQVGKVYEWRLSDPASVWTLDLKHAPGKVASGPAQAADCTLELTEDDFVAMTSGQADPQKLYFSGRLKIGGDVMASQKLTFLAKVAAAAEAGGDAGARGGSGATAPVADSGDGAVAPAAPSEVFSAFLRAVGERLAARPERAADAGGATVALSVTDPEGAAVLRLGAQPPAVVLDGPVEDPSVTLTMSAETLGVLGRGEDTLQGLYQRGKIRVDGDVGLARRLTFLEGVLP